MISTRPRLRSRRGANMFSGSILNSNPGRGTNALRLKDPMARTATSSRSRPSRPVTSPFPPNTAMSSTYIPSATRGQTGALVHRTDVPHTICGRRRSIGTRLSSARQARRYQYWFTRRIPRRPVSATNSARHHRQLSKEEGNPSLGNVFDGTYYLTASGTPDRPIVIKGAGDGEAIFDGDGAQNLFNLMAANYNYFEGITVRNTNVAFLLGLKSIVGASGFTLKRSRSTMSVGPCRTIGPGRRISTSRTTSSSAATIR